MRKGKTGLVAEKTRRRTPNYTMPQMEEHGDVTLWEEKCQERNLGIFVAFRFVFECHYPPSKRSAPFLEAKEERSTDGIIVGDLSALSAKQSSDNKGEKKENLGLSCFFVS
jgi:hypothetical protein